MAKGCSAKKGCNPTSASYTWRQHMLGGGPATSLPPLNWFNTANVDITNNGYTLKANGGNDNDYNARCPYSDLISTNGIFDRSFTIGEDDSFFGITNSTAIASTYSDIDYSFLRKPTGFFIVEGGALNFFVMDLDRTKTIRIVSNGAIVNYFYNGINVYTSGNPITLLNYMFKSAMYENLTPIGNNIL